MTSSQVRVLNISHVRPVQTDGASPPGQGEHKLSFMDLLQISKTIQRLFFDGPDLPPFPTVVSALRSSLAATLAVFPPLAGELAFRPVSGSGDVVIDSSPAAIASSPGVRFVEAEFAGGADAMRRLARDDAHDAEAFARLVPELLEARRLPAPVLAVQVTRPAAGAGAVAVGVSIAHAVADGHAVWQFLRAWSTASREGPASLAAPGFVPPTFDRAGIRHPKSAELVRSVLSRVAPALPLLRPASSKPEIMEQSRRTFLLRAEEIRSLKQHILERSGAASRGNGEPPEPPSTYVAVTSLAWASVARATPAMLDADDAHLMVSADCRRRLRLPLGNGFFGTCVKACYARARAGDLRGAAGVARAAAAIRRPIRAHLEEGDPLSDAEGWLAAYGAVPKERLVTVGSSNRFAAYETDFGWGAPRRVELVSLFAPRMVTLLGARDGGVQVSVALDGATMDAFAASFAVPAPVPAAGAVSVAR
ncbi:anthocyanin 5-aromatic acyltransferase-like isoform X2 [Panicum virgatum]|uniref:Uncharacterized protein n=1 Tax=Panicum virgatum TaxID=38727 RepID=A0A8T0TKY1_PANVG|nr:anthocyanin 5-aromatic acyltransferase-like isoform X2 [Panicum virgatum]KAG2612592.1 hypothetical protein PVAP13_4KG300400 [Panicum virgatum]